MSIFGGGGSSAAQATNQQVVNMQQTQANQAANKAAQTQANLDYGANYINQLFQGTPSGSTLLDLSSIANAANSGQTAGAQAVGANSPWQPGMTGGQLAGGYSWDTLGDTGTGSPTYGIWDPSGNLVTSASTPQQLAASQIYTGGNPSQTTGGFGPDFYNNYQKSILNYYLPQEGQQYNTARTNLNYALARAGQLNSSTAATDIANLAQQDQLNQAQIASNADTQTAGLRNQIQQDQQTALNQLYSTENPSVAANTALNTVANANMTTPVLSPLSQLFGNISVGVGNAISGYTNPYAYITNPAGSASTTSPSTSSGVQGQGG